MTGLEEVIVIVASSLLLIGAQKSIKKFSTIINKRKLKKLLNLGFDDLDFDIIKEAISGLLDYDSRNGSRKLDKFLLPIIKKFRNDDTKMNINEKNLKEAVKDFSKLSSIFDEDEEEEEEQLNIVDEKIEQVDADFMEVKKRREEVLRRKNQIRAIQRNNKRSSGNMG